MVAAEKETETKTPVTPTTPKIAKVVATAPKKPQEKTVERPEKPRQVRRVEVPKPKEEPDLVMVRALERGQYGLDIDIIIRNAGEVFPMATSAMRRVEEVDGDYVLAQPTRGSRSKDALAKKEWPVEGSTIIETPRGFFELPGWVELIGDDEEIPPDALRSHGHNKKWHQQIAADGTKTMDVI